MTAVPPRPNSIDDLDRSLLAANGIESVVDAPSAAQLTGLFHDVLPAGR